MDYKQYHKDWRDVIRPKILERDNYKCRVCQIPHKARVYRKSKGEYQILDDWMEDWAVQNGFKVFTLYLQVAHVNHDKKDKRPENLISLCPYHHGRYDKNYKRLARKVYKVAIQTANPSKPTIHQLNSSDEIGVLSKLIKSYTGVSLSPKQLEQIINTIKSSNHYVTT